MKTKFLKIMLTYTEVTSGFSGMNRAVANTYFTPSSFYALKERIRIKRNDRDAKLQKKYNGIFPPDNIHICFKYLRN